MTATAKTNGMDFTALAVRKISKVIAFSSEVNFLLQYRNKDFRTNGFFVTYKGRKIGVITPHEADKYDPWGYAGKIIKDYLEEGKGPNTEIIGVTAISG